MGKREKVVMVILAMAYVLFATTDLRRVALGSIRRPHVASTTKVSLRADEILACTVEIAAYNRDRYVRQEVDAECPPEFSSHPWGNWGVDSLFGYRWDGSQYEGWKDAEGHIEWNSCTQGDWNAGNPWFNVFVSGEGYVEQETSEGDNLYGYIGFHLIPEDEENGCSEFDDYDLTIYNNWFEAYELDDFPGNPDDFVDEVAYGNFVIDLTCTYSSCSLSWSNALWALGVNELISQEVQAKLIDVYLEWIEDPGECDPCEV